MGTDLSQRRIQVLYEMSLAISPGTDVRGTVESAVSTYLQKLNCSAAAVFEPVGAPEGGREVLTTLPDQYAFSGAIEGTRDLLPDEARAVAATLPVVDEIESGVHRYVMSLPEFGVLLLLKRGSPLPEDIVMSLPDLNEKLATACKRLAIQRQYETQYRDLFQEAPVMFALTRHRDGEPVLVDCNDRFAEKLGYTPAELDGRPLAEFYTDDSRESLREGGYDEALDGQLGTEERVFQTREGTEITTTMRATPRIDDDGTVVGTRALFIDVTELKRQKVQISVLNRVLRHNIRNDLTVIRSKIEMALDSEGDASAHLRDAYEKTEDLSSAADLARRIQEIVDETDLVHHDVGRLVDSLARRARETYPEATLTASVEASDIPVLATTALERALWELVENACEHAGDAPSVGLTAGRTDSTARVTVADDGPGIPEIERRILGESEETETEHGSGLGLWLAYWVIDMSGGDLTFDCDDGTVATVTLPLSTGGQ
jgi:PAS domain S-box-containing protein